MILGILQPYLFPYVGYFQLIGAVDTLVIYDDVQWIKGGWINRNRYLVEGQSRYFTLPVGKKGFPKPINQCSFAPDIELHKQRILRQVQYNYRRAPHFEAVFSLLSACFACKDDNVSRFLVNSLRLCCDYLGIATPFVLSSQIEKRNGLSGAEQVLEINRALHASHYINPAGGTALYDASLFAERGVRLDFLRAREAPYRQFEAAFRPALSIIDVMMFNAIDEISHLLKEYDLE